MHLGFLPLQLGGECLCVRSCKQLCSWDSSWHLDRASRSQAGEQVLAITPSWKLQPRFHFDLTTWNLYARSLPHAQHTEKSDTKTPQLEYDKCCERNEDGNISDGQWWALFRFGFSKKTDTETWLDGLEAFEGKYLQRIKRRQVYMAGGKTFSPWWAWWKEMRVGGMGRASDCRTLWKVLAKPMGHPLAEDAHSRTPTWAGAGQH